MTETAFNRPRHAAVPAPAAAPCPFCGSQVLTIESLGDTAIISCRDCLAVGPVTAGQRVSAAWAKWNARPRQAPDEAEDFGCACRDLPHLPVDFAWGDLS